MQLEGSSQTVCDLSKKLNFTNTYLYQYTFLFFIMHKSRNFRQEWGEGGGGGGGFRPTCHIKVLKFFFG